MKSSGWLSNLRAFVFLWQLGNLASRAIARR